MSERFKALRFGVFNFWYYDEEEFELSDGKILFRGTNGSGKSVTAQSFIPLLLDGDKRPERLDPFGSKARKIENYVLAYQEDTDRTSYLYIEFGKPEKDIYITIGMGLRARRGKPLESWYFILKDGRRINKDFKVYKNSGEKYALTAKELQNALGEGNFFTKLQKEYMAKVNENLFGYSDIEDYKDLITLLIQLRTPKLSKDFKPTVIYDVLNKSLSTLSDDDLRTVAETMENMDSLNLKIEQEELGIAACNRISAVLDKYSRQQMYKKARQYLKYKKKFENLKNENAEKEQEYKNLKNETEKLYKEIEKLNTELKNAEKIHEELKNDKSYQLSDEITKNKNILKEINRNLKETEDKFSRKVSKKCRLSEEKDSAELQIYKREKEYKEILEDEEYYREESQYPLDADLINDIKNNKENTDFSKCIQGVKEYKKNLMYIMQLLEKKEKIEKELNKLEKAEYSQSLKVKAEENNLRETQEYLTVIKEEFREKAINYLKNTSEFKISDDALTDFFKSVNKIKYSGETAELEKYLNDRFFELKNDIINLKSEKKSDLKIKTNEIKEIEEEIKNLEETEEALDKYKKTERAEKILIKNNIPSEIFYKCFKFKENIEDDENKRIIENILLETGIINSLIIPEEFEKQSEILLHGDFYKIIKPMQKFTALTDDSKSESCIIGNYKVTAKSQKSHKETEKIKFETEISDKENTEQFFCGVLENFIEPEQTEFARKYSDYLINILKAASSTILFEKFGGKLTGKFKIRNIDGFYDISHELKFLGINSRKEFKRLKIEELSAEKREKENELKQIQENIDIIDAREKKLEAEREKFISFDDINAQIQLIDEAEKKLDTEIKEQNFIKDKINDLLQEKSRADSSFFDAKKGITINPDSISYAKAAENTENYKDVLEDLKDISKDLKNISEKNKSLQNQLSETEEEILELNEKQSEERRKKEQLSNAIKMQEKMFEESGAAEFKEKMAHITDIIENNPVRIENKKEEKIRKETQYNNLEDKIKENILKIKNTEAYFEVLKEILKNEISLGNLEELKDKTYDEAAKYAEKNFREMGNKNSFEPEVIKIAEQNRNYLSDYHVQSKQNESINIDENRIHDEEEITSLKELDARVIVQGKKERKYISIKELSEILKGQVETLKLLIKDNERRIFEDILINTLSTKIVAKISKTQSWVKDIDKLMGNMKTSSGFKLSLSWKPKKTAAEDEMNTKELVELLQKKNFSTEKEQIDISKHFREKLKHKRRETAEDGNSKNYHTIIKEILDYREWFEFQISFSKTDSPKKELTDNEFFKLSGGEKAMAMYVPLFAAVNVRYKQADKKDAPKIISLDEAFAGVDDDNIGSLFEFLEELDLDYVLNSQVLWGTYEKVKNLAIYEIVRNGEEIVTIGFNWNGREKEYKE